MLYITYAEPYLHMCYILTGIDIPLLYLSITGNKE